jgi:type IVB pilus formation R64 PilN family outer membrane protein
MSLPGMKRIVVAVLITSLLGCKPAPLYYSAKADVAKAQADITASQQRDYLPPAPVVTQPGAYVDTTRVSLHKRPAWTKNHVSLHGVNLPFSFYVSQVIGNEKVLIHFDDTIDRKKLISINYSGSAQGALAEIASHADYHYEFDLEKNAINWSAFISKTFTVSFMPGTSQYQVGNSASATPSLAGTTGGSGSSGSTTSTTGVDLMSDSQYSQLVGNVSLWRDIEATIKNLLSTEGQVTVSQSTTSITVRDHPVNVAAVERFLNKMNRELSRQVRLEVQVIEVQLTKDFSYGIDWQLVRQFTDRSISLLAPEASNTSISSVTPAGLIFAASSGHWAGTKTIIDALQQQGEIGIVTQPALTTMNNQVAQIAIKTMQNYISQIQGSSSSGGSSIAVTSSGATVDTSTLTTGVNLYLLPKIQGDKVFLQLSTTLSNLVSLDKINTTTGDITPSSTTNTPTPTPSNAQPSFVQLPNVNARSLNQRAVIPSGATLVLAGFRQKNDAANLAKLYNTAALGGQSAESRMQELVLLITPTILSEEEFVEEGGS